VSRARDFLKAGDKVRLTLRFRGRREIANVGMGKDVMKRMLVNFDDIAVLDSVPTLSGRELSCVLRRGQQKKAVA
jgi:translation initiation factor IF-3